MSNIRITIAIMGGVAIASTAMVTLVGHAEAEVNREALADQPLPVSTATAAAATYAPTRAYVGTLEPWDAASIGPQFVAAYVEDVRVRPGARVGKGDVLATLDCRDATSSTAAVAARARALDAQQQALAKQVERLKGLGEHGYVSADDVDQRTAASLAQGEQLAAERAHLSEMTLQVADCVLRAPFAGDVTGRFVDPGAFVRPGASIVALTDRHTVRFTADVPENDFRLVEDGKPVSIHVDSLGVDLAGVVARRSPSADPATRTVHFEVDLANADRAIPVNVTGVATLAIGAPVAAVTIPLRAAAVSHGMASVFVVDRGVAHARSVKVIGEAGERLFVDPSLGAAQVVTEGRTLLVDGAKVAAQGEHP